MPRMLTASVLRAWTCCVRLAWSCMPRHDDIASVSNAFEIDASGMQHEHVSLQLLADSPHLITMGRDRREVIARVAGVRQQDCRVPALRGRSGQKNAVGVISQLSLADQMASALLVR